MSGRFYKNLKRQRDHFFNAYIYDPDIDNNGLFTSTDSYTVLNSDGTEREVKYGSKEDIKKNGPFIVQPYMADKGWRKFKKETRRVIRKPVIVSETFEISNVIEADNIPYVSKDDDYKPQMFNKKMGNKLREIREGGENPLTRKELANKMNITESVLAAMENGTGTIPFTPGIKKLIYAIFGKRLIYEE